MLFVFHRFGIFRRALDAKMKDGTRQGIAVQNKKEEKMPVKEEDQKKFWDLRILGKDTAKSLNVVCFYNGKLFGLRAGEHRNLSLNNFEIADNFIRFEENVSKTFYGGLLDLKYELRVVKNICDNVGDTHEPCLVELNPSYISLVESFPISDQMGKKWI